MQANANFLGNDLMKYEGDTETCIVTCSANLHSLGNILNISSEIQRILQYSNVDLIGQSINQMMPNMIARLHDDFMRNFFETSKSVRVGRETVIYPVNKSGYIVPCAITVKVIPNLNDGLKMVGFLNELSQGKPNNPQEKGISSAYNKMHYILYGGENNVVHGVTESCFQAFGISSSLTLAQNIDFSEFTIDKIFPDLLLQNTQELRTGGLILKINTTALAQEYLAAKNSALFEEEDE
jgi:PAS domain S-box-containing protein